jgi:hypothetical protein
MSHYQYIFKQRRCNMFRTNYITILVATLCLTTFFCSRRPISKLGEPQDYKSLVAQMHKKTLTDEVKQQFVKMGMPALNYLLDDFEQSDFVKETRKSLKRGFDLGKAMDKNVFASNVIRVTEGFGTIGIDALIGRLSPDFVDFFLLNTPQFHELGVGTIKPLLTMNMLENPTNDEQAREEKWITTFADKRRIIGDHEEFNKFNNGFWVSVAASVVGAAVWEGLKWLTQHLPKGPEEWDGLTSFQRKTIPEKYRKNLLSPAVRSEILLKRLDPEKKVLKPSAN